MAMSIKDPKTPRVSRKQKKEAKMYADNPTWAAEDANVPVPGYKKIGGATKTNKMKKYKTGGMVNANAKITAAKAAPGSVGGISKAISKGAVKSTSPKGKVGGTSTAPKSASPKKTK